MNKIIKLCLYTLLLISITGCATSHYYTMESKEFKDIGQAQVGPRVGAFKQKYLGSISPQLREYEQLKEGIASVLARGLYSETGTLNEGDIQRAKSNMPSVTDDYQTALNKIARMKNLVSTNLAMTTGEQ